MGTLSIQAGLIALQNKNYKAVHADSIRAVQQDPYDPVPYFLLGVIAADHGNVKKASELFLRAESLDAANAFYPAFLAKTLSEARRPIEAKIAADRAVKCEIVAGFLADILGVVYSRCGFHDLAIPQFKRAINLNPKPTNFYYNLGASAQFMGDFKTAEAAYENALERDPKHYRALASVISLRKQTKEYNRLPTLKSLYEAIQGEEDAAHQIGHAIAKTLEDLGQYQESFDWLLKAKAMKREDFRYNRQAGAETFAAAAQTIQAVSNGAPLNHSPIFIVGLPRTGTTLVDRILSSHSAVESAGELNIFSELIKARTGTSSKHVLDSQTFLATKQIDLAEIGREYLRQAKSRVSPAAQFIDKMPLNFFYVGLIHKALPNSRIIALRRGAMDSCLSNFRQLLSVKESFYNYTFDLQDTAFFYRQFDGLMKCWREALSPDGFMEIHYEDIVHDQENQTRRLLKFCNLEFEEACMRFHENAAPVSTASSVQVRKPLYSGSIGRWKKYGDRLDGLRSALGPIAD